MEMSAMNLIEEIALPGVLFLLAVVFGIWVSSLGRPYQGLLFNVHKLIALGGVVLALVRVLGLDPLEYFPPSAVLCLIPAALSVLALFITGALMSIRKEESRLMRRIHQISPVVITVAALGEVYLLSRVAH
jgi:hypothetical protein